MSDVAKRVDEALAVVFECRCSAYLDQSPSELTNPAFATLQALRPFVRAAMELMGFRKTPSDYPDMESVAKWLSAQGAKLDSMDDAYRTLLKEIGDE